MINQEQKLQSLVELRAIQSQSSSFFQQQNSVQKQDQTEQLQQDTQSLLQLQYIQNPKSLSNTTLMSNNQYSGQTGEESNTTNTENKMVRGSFNTQDNRMVIMQNFMVIPPQFNSDFPNQNIAHNIYQSNNCTNLVHPNTNNSFQIGTSSLNYSHLNQPNNTSLPQLYNNNQSNFAPGIAVGGLIYTPEQFQQLQNKQYQYNKLQQTSSITNIGSDDLNQSQIFEYTPFQQGIVFNYDMQANYQQQQLMQQYPLQNNPVQQFGIPNIPTYLQPQTSQINISNSQHSDSSKNKISQKHQKQNIGQINQQKINSGSLSQAELQKLNFYNQQNNNINKSIHTIQQTARINNSLKSSLSENDSVSNKEKVNNQDEHGKNDYVNIIKSHQFNQARYSALKHENLKANKKFEQAPSQQTNQTNRSLNLFNFQKIKEEDLIQEKNNKISLLFPQKLNKKISIDESSQESASQLIRSSQSIRHLQNKGRIEYSGDNVDEYRVQLNKKNDQNSRFSQSTYSSLSPSKTNHLTSKYRHMSQDKTNTMSFILDQGNHLEVYVDNRKRRTSIDHSFYIQLGNLLTDKNVVKEFTNLILCQGVDRVSSQKEIDQSNYYIENESNKSEKIKRYKQLLNQTFFEMKHQQTPKNSQKDISYQDQIEDLNIKLEEHAIENEDIQFNERGDNYDNSEYIHAAKQFNQKQLNKIRQVNSIISSIQEAILVKIPLLFKEDNILDSINLIPSGQYQVYSNLQNMCIQFVRGEKRKRFKERNKDSQYMSRFHNLNRLFFYQIMSIYSYESLSCFQIDSTISEQMRIIISFIKIHSKLQLINQNKKTSSVSSQPFINKGQESPNKNKRKRQQSDRESIDVFENLIPSQQKESNNHVGKQITSNLQDDKQQTKKSQKINQKELDKLQYSNNLNRETNLSNQIKESNFKSSSIPQRQIHEHSSHTPSPIIKLDKQSIFNQLQDTLKKSSSSYSGSIEIEGNLSKNFSNNFEENQTNNISNDIQSFLKSDKTKKQSKNKQSIAKKKQNQQSDSSNENIEDSDLKDEDYALEDEILGDNDLEDLDYDFPIKNYKRFYRILKVENYTHSHYNTLFLKLNPQSIDHLRKQSKDVDSHWLAYKIDLRNPQDIPPEKIQYVNIMKSLFFKVFIHFNNINFSQKQQEQEKILNTIINDPSQPITKDSQEFKSIELRLDYYLRVVLGIQKLNQGYYSHKF